MMSPHAPEGLAFLLQAATANRGDVDLDAWSERDVRWAIEVGFGPLLHHLTRDGRAGRFHQVLLAQDLAARVECGLRLDALEEVLAAVHGLAVDVVLLKGVSLCRRVYPEPHLRMMGDIDLLVPPAAQVTLEAVLRDLGYVQRSPQPPEFYRGHHHSMPFVHPQRRVYVEVHTALFRAGTAPATAPLFDSQRVYAGRVPDGFRGFPVNRLADEVELGYVATHSIYERKCFGTAMIPMLDLALILGRLPAGFDWERLLDGVAGTAAGAQVRVALGFLHDRVGLPLPAPVRAHLTRLSSRPGPAADRLLYRMIGRYAVHGQAFGRWWTRNQVTAMWDGLLVPRPAWINLVALPWRLLIPPGHPRRYDLRFHLRRLATPFVRRLRVDALITRNRE